MITRILQTIGLVTCLVCVVVITDRLLKAPEPLVTESEIDPSVSILPQRDPDSVWGEEPQRVLADSETSNPLEREIRFYETAEVEVPQAPDSAADVASELNVVFAAFSPTETSLDGAVAAPSDAEDRRKVVKDFIRARFPDLDNDVLAGWVDSYIDVPLKELGGVLEQRSNLPQLNFSGLDALAEFPTDAEEQAHGQARLLDEMRSIVRTNILHIPTPGYRRRILRTQLKGLDSAVDASAVQLTPGLFDFSAGLPFSSDRPLHVAITNNRQHHVMFRLEPGCVLTRCGAFERLEDGRIGLTVGKQSLALYGAIRVPEDAVNLKISDSGLVTHRGDSAGSEATSSDVKLGQIKVAVVDDMSLLQSNNGVFFSLDSEMIDRHVRMSSKVSLRIGSLERANVVLEKEIGKLKQVDLLAK